jgi:thiamine monophosphate synthase
MKVFSGSPKKKLLIQEIMDCGAKGVVMISAILGSKDIKKAAERILRYLQ